MNKRIPPSLCLDFYDDIESWWYSSLLDKYYVVIGKRSVLFGDHKKITFTLTIL